MNMGDQLLRGFSEHCGTKLKLGPAETMDHRNRWLWRKGEKQESGIDACSDGQWEEGFKGNTGVRVSRLLNSCIEILCFI